VLGVLVLVIVWITPDDLSRVFGWIVAGIGVVGFIAATAQFVRGSADRGTIISLQNSVNALETSNELKDKDNAELLKKVDSLTSELEVWRNAVTAKEELQHLTTTVLEHHVQSMKEVHTLKENQAQILANQDILSQRIADSEAKIVAAATEVKKLVARMHGELAEIRNVVKP
jgi:chromosome segregation ATPase